MGEHSTQGKLWAGNRLKFQKHTEVEQSGLTKGMRSTWYRADNITSGLYPRNIRADIFPAIKAGRRVWHWQLVHENLRPKSTNEEAEFIDGGMQPTASKAMSLINAICTVTLQASQKEE